MSYDLQKRIWFHYNFSIDCLYNYTIYKFSVKSLFIGYNNIGYN
jgi:hypothetical protein